MLSNERLNVTARGPVQSASASLDEGFGSRFTAAELDHPPRATCICASAAMRHTLLEVIPIAERSEGRMAELDVLAGSSPQRAEAR
jgi:hypothetical protein